MVCSIVCYSQIVKREKRREGREESESSIFHDFSIYFVPAQSDRPGPAQPMDKYN